MKTEGFSTREEMDQAIKATGAKFVTYQNRGMRIHYPDCGRLFMNGGGIAGYYAIHKTYADAKSYADSRNPENTNCQVCERRHGRML